MRAVVVNEFGGPEVLKIQDNVQIPECKDNQVLVRVMAAGLNPVDTYIRSGTYARKPKLPYIPGMDAAGVVEATGPSVKNFKKGDRVFCSRSVEGSYAEYCSVSENSCWMLPDRLTYNQGAAIGVPYFTAYRALFQKSKAKPSSVVLVHGASGAVGLAAVQVAHAAGMTVLGTAGTAEGLNLVRKSGADFVFSHKEQNYCQKILESTNNEGVDVILEMLSNVNLGKDLTLLKQNGTVAVVGCRGNVEINPRMLMNKESSIVGVSLSSATNIEWSDMGAAILAGLHNGCLNPVIDKEYPLEKVALAHKDIIENEGAKGKLVLALASQC
jgi:NADPH2:quinone reductase